MIEVNVVLCVCEQISKQRELEEASFRKVLTAERKKFDKKILDARNMLQRRFVLSTT